MFHRKWFTACIIRGIWWNVDFIFSLPLNVQAALQHPTNHFVDARDQSIVIANGQRYCVICDILTAIETEDLMICVECGGDRMDARYANSQITVFIECQLLQAFVDVIAYGKRVDRFLLILEWNRWKCGRELL